ncbi:hypothetical protein [Kibdelosporangium philippinense]|uniref:hypothetical protein n=1 Tax=Kibdelosporangium philippinense TaxID=211113 RepID=UPI003610F913
MTPTSRGSRATSEAGRLAALLLSPTFVVLGLVVGYPLVAALRESLYRTGQTIDADGFVVQGEQFVGVDNYAAIFTGTRPAGSGTPSATPLCSRW